MTLVSVIMAVYNGERYLNEAIGSILSQQGPELELIIIDDGSADATRDILARQTDQRVVVHRNERNLGLTASLNIGLNMAKGQFVARMDADDTSLPGRLEAQCNALQSEDAQICFCRAYFHDENTEKKHPWCEIPWTLALWRGLFSNYYGLHPAVMFRRQDILGAGGYNERFCRGQDYELWDRCLALGMKVVYVKEALLLYRRHDEMISRHDSAAQFETGRVVSLRALGRAFPDASEDELLGLHWLMFQAADISPNPRQIELAVERCAFRVNHFLESHGGADHRAVWRSVAVEASFRLGDLDGRTRWRALGLALQAGFRAGSPFMLARTLMKGTALAVG